MKSLLKSILKVLGIVFLVLYLGIEILVTVCLLNFNDQRVTVIGDTSWVIADSDFSDEYKKGDLILVSKGTGEEVNEGDSIFFYNPSENYVINYAEVVRVNEFNGYYTYVVGNDYNVYFEYFVGKDATVFRGVGTILSVLQSKWGFLLLIILPTMVAIIFEIYAIIIEIIELKKEA